MSKLIIKQMKKTKFKVLSYGTLILSALLLGNRLILADSAKNPLNPSQEVEPLGPAMDYQTTVESTSQTEQIESPKNKIEVPKKVDQKPAVKKVTRSQGKDMLTEVFKTPALTLNPRNPFTGGNDHLENSYYWSKVAKCFTGKVIIGQVTKETQG